jgi:DNA modification methylase
MEINLMQIKDRIKEFKRVRFSELKANQKNWRKHPQKQKDAMAGVLRSVGWADAVLARETESGLELIDGHLRKEIAEDAEVPVLILDVNEQEADLILATHDPLAEMATTDQKTLDELITNLDFDDLQTNELLSLLSSTPREVGEDEIPEPPADPVTVPGNLFQLGEHRLYCGDSTKHQSWEICIGDTRADLLLTDPPYNIAYKGGSKVRDEIENDSMSSGDFQVFLVDVFTKAFDHMKAGASFYIWHADSEGLNFRKAIKACGEEVRQCLIWNKHSKTIGRQDYHWKHEPCLYGWKKGAAHGWYNDRKQTTVLEFDRPTKSEEHPTMKPVDLFAYQLGNNTSPQGIVIDPFLGSGTTLIAAEQLGRRCFGMEMSPAYCDVIVQRWESLTGKKAEVINGAGKKTDA